MIAKKIKLSALFLLSAILSINAQDEKAKKILDEVSAKTKSYSTIKADFTWIIEKKDKSKDTQKGKIQIKGAKYKLEIPGHIIYCDGNTIWDYIKDINEAQIKDVEEDDEDAITPSNIFTIYEKGFKYKFDKEDANNQYINLFPSNPDKKKYHTIKLTIDKKKKQITSVKVMMKDGTTQTYTISSFEANTAIPDSTFTFNKSEHPGVTVEDLR